MTYLIIALAVLVPCLPMRVISQPSLYRIRDAWLWGLLLIGTLWAFYAAPPFGPVGVALLWWWRSSDELPSVVTWVGLGATWALLKTLPPWAWGPVTIAWVVIGSFVSGILILQWARGNTGDNPWWHPFRWYDTGKAWFGQRTLAAAFVALVLPFFPGWSIFVPIVSLLTTCSWTALAAAYVGLGILHPRIFLFGGIALASVGVAVCIHPKLLWYTPRGNSLDSVWQRLLVWRLALAMVRDPRWYPAGYGPRSMDFHTQLWGVRHGVQRVPLGNLHMELFHFLHEYGLCGAVACGLLVATLLPHLRWGDPWSAAWGAGTVLALGTIPLRAISTGIIFLSACVRLAGAQ